MPQAPEWERIARDGELYFEGIRPEGEHWVAIRVEHNDEVWIITPLQGTQGRAWLDIKRVRDNDDD